MKTIIPANYQDLISQASHYPDYSLPKAEDLLKHFGFKGLALHAQAPIFYVVDYVHQKYLFIDPSSKNLLGYDLDVITENGPLYYINLWHPNDLKIANAEIFPTIKQFLKKQSATVIPDLSFSFNYRVKANGGDYCSVIQRSTFYVHPTDNTPLAAVGFIMDISHFKDDTKITFTIEKVDRQFCSVTPAPLFKHSYYPEKAPGIFSRRELEILELIYRGKGTKQIANTLCIAENTVKNHRKNMLAKPKCSNTADLIAYAIRHGILEAGRLMLVNLIPGACALLDFETSFFQLM
ncbi:response regulator transcription factor [Adhaeribacter radiodurans]|uniref:HTH luxR-type domain-containing protein n=1 Tax=Adhaeribacter radiodurans TaxID=2745197 RepID=A0A7L7LCF9_9BACT|nr:LuxR C-terminal-related transcriptional regulator [Adhaeribacter radiodurans]QMU30530.1 hypothetical protein HUW48_22005 [Adhaeribacter radiodurans]